MIKTEKIIKHQICCDKCGGTLKLRPHTNEFEILLKESKNVGCSFTTAIRPEVPTCTNCGKQYQIKFDSHNMTVEMQDYK